MLVRFGVSLQPLKARILDMIADVTRGRGSIETDSLCSVFYGGVALSVARRRIVTQIHQLNEALVETDAVVRSKLRGGVGVGKECALYWLEFEGRPYGKAPR